MYYDNDNNNPMYYIVAKIKLKLIILDLLIDKASLMIVRFVFILFVMVERRCRILPAKCLGYSENRLAYRRSKSELLIRNSYH